MMTHMKCPKCGSNLMKRSYVNINSGKISLYCSNGSCDFYMNRKIENKTNSYEDKRIENQINQELLQNQLINDRGILISMILFSLDQGDIDMYRKLTAYARLNHSQ